jgi:hypothetical protein
MRSVGKIALAALFGLIALTSCSHKKSNPIAPAPPIPQEGRIAVVNNSNVSIRIAGYTHVRGSVNQSVELWVHIFPSQDFILHNLIDPGQSQLFPGGDVITVLYYADERDPSNPSQPLFQETVQLTVDGNRLIQVKGDGKYSIFPG